MNTNLNIYRATSWSNENTLFICSMSYVWIKVPTVENAAACHYFFVDFHVTDSSWQITDFGKFVVDGLTILSINVD